MSGTILALASVALPLFPSSMVVNGLLAAAGHPVLRAVLLLAWPQVGVIVLARLEGPPPEWVLWWAVATSGLYAFRLLTVRDVQQWAGFLATSQWALLWMLAANHSDLLPIAALGLSTPAAIITLLARGLERRFGAAFAGLYGGLATSMPRYASVLAAALVASMATPPFPGFAVLMLVLLSTPSTALLAAVPIIALGWSWAGIRLGQGLLVGPVEDADHVADLNLGWALANIIVLLALVGAGIWLTGALT